MKRCPVKNNDLSAQPVPRIALVLEGALAFTPVDRRERAKFQRHLDRGQWDEAVNMMEFNERMETVIWDRAVRASMTIDVITYLGPDEWAAAVARRISLEELPIHKVWATTPQILGRKLAFMYDLQRVYDPWPEHQLYFGQRGVLITNPNQLGH